MLFLYFFLVAFSAIFFHFWNRNFRIEHGFIVFELDQEVFVSLEKLSGGFLFQIAKSLDTVSENAKNATRGMVEEISSSESLGFDATLAGVVSMGMVLQFEDMFDAYYSLLRKNCQHTVSQLLDCIPKIRCHLNFAFLVQRNQSL